MRDVDRYFIGLGVVAALLGMGLGIWMSIFNDYLLMPLHAHINLVGWVSLALFGLAYRTGLARNDGWAVVHFWLAFAAVVIFSVGIFISLITERPKIAFIGGYLTVASMVLFGVNVIRARFAK